MESQQHREFARSLRWHTQPLKGALVAFTLASLFIRVPYYAIVSVPPSLRLRPTWSFKTSFLVRVMRCLIHLAAKTGLGALDIFPANYDQLATGVFAGKKYSGVWVEGVPHLIVGCLETWANMASVTPMCLPGYWTHASEALTKVGAEPELEEKVIYALHGGVFTQLSAHPGSLPGCIPRDLMPYCKGVKRVFSMEFRQSVGFPNRSANPFPAALIDALSGYNYLVNVIGFAPRDIIIVGDSSGANTALALTRYLIQYRDTLGASLPRPPGALILLSTMADIGTSHIQPGSSAYTNLDADILSEEQMLYSKLAFTGPHGMGAAATNEYMSPASHDIPHVSFVGFPKTFIVTGEVDTLKDQSQTLYERMAKDLGSDVVYYEAKDMIHNFLCFDILYGSPRTETFQKIGDWLSAP